MVSSTLLIPATHIQTHKATKPQRYIRSDHWYMSYFFKKGSTINGLCMCSWPLSHKSRDSQDGANSRTHKKINKIHSVEIRSLTPDACIHMKGTHHPLLTTPLSAFNLFGIILTRTIPTSDRTRGCSIHLTQNIGIISNTSSQGELSYLASSLHVAFTAQKVRLTILRCRAKWNYRQRESTTQRLCVNQALTSARLAMHRKWRSS